MAWRDLLLFANVLVLVLGVYSATNAQMRAPESEECWTPDESLSSVYQRWEEAGVDPNEIVHTFKGEKLHRLISVLEEINGASAEGLRERLGRWTMVEVEAVEQVLLMAYDKNDCFKGAIYIPKSKFHAVMKRAFGVRS